MVRMTVKMKENRFRDTNIEEIYDAVDRVTSRNRFKKVGEGLYEGAGSPHDFALMGRVVLYLKKRNWFMKNVEIWLLDVDGDVEDLATHYKRKVCAGKQ